MTGLKEIELIKWKLDKVTEVWNHYFWEYKFLQKKINFNSDTKTNYYGEILSYFHDTFNLLHLNKSNKFHENIFHYTGLLQIIYVQQDLMDELLHIFKLQKAPLIDKNPNREIRNELVGHPIRRNKKGNELISSVLFSNDTSNSILQYIIYSKSNNFKMKLITHDTQHILDRHKLFLNKYFDIILNKICLILSGYGKRLTEFEDSLTSNIKFEKIIHQTETSFEFLLRFNYLYKKEYLIECFRRQKEHTRYKFAVNLFLKELQLRLEESKKNILDFIAEKETGPKKYSGISEKPLFEEYIDVKIKPSKRKIKSDFTYELGKLHGKSPVITIDYFKRIFNKNKKVLEELANMEANFNNDVEYYASFEYLRKLILKKKYDL